MSSFLENLEWRNATKKFDPSRSLSSGEKEKILASTRLAPTSFGLQPFHVILVEDPKVREEIFKAGWNQPQYTTAAMLMVFCSRSDIKARIEEYFQIASDGDATKRAKLVGYEQMMRGALEGRSPEDLHVWGAKQAYIALGFAMAACAELKVDSCPMEGFSPAEVDKVLKLPAHLKSCVMLTIGHRPAGTTVNPKVRFPNNDLFSKK